MTSDRTRELVLPLAVLVSVAVGVLVGHWIAGERGVRTTSAAISPAEARELIDVLQAMRADMARLSEARSELSASPAGSERVVAASNADGPKSDIAKELHAATAQLAAAVESLKVAVDRPGGDPDRLNIPSTPRDTVRLVETATRDVTQVQQEFLLWTRQQILSEFGKPDSIHVNDARQDWVYWTATHSLTFSFHDGRVFAVQGRSR
jgi:hypothetical protein